MDRATSIACVAGALLALSWSPSGMAQGDCGDIEFSPDISSRFPNARTACLGIVERDGREFAHFQARILRVRGNEVQAEFRLPNGEYGQPVSFTPPPEARVRIQGRTYRYRDLSRGQELDVYLPPDRWAIAVPEDPEGDDFVAAERVTIVALAAVPEEQQVAQALPRTASVLPLLGLLGMALSVLGAAVAVIRRRFHAGP
ncbi:MAG TPA: hypothetical protein VIN61_06160 [Gammaproteobacteria bacterium]